MKNGGFSKGISPKSPRKIRFRNLYLILPGIIAYVFFFPERKWQVWWGCWCFFLFDGVAVLSQLSDQRCPNVSTVHLQASSRCFCFKDWWLDMTRGLQLHGTDITDPIFGMDTAYISQTYTTLSFSLCNVLHLEGTQIHILVILGDLFCDITWCPSHVDRFPRMSNPPQQWHTISVHFTRGWSKRWCTFHPRYLNPRVLTNRSQTCCLQYGYEMHVPSNMASFWVSMVDFQGW